MKVRLPTLLHDLRTLVETMFSLAETDRITITTSGPQADTEFIEVASDVRGSSSIRVVVDGRYGAELLLSFGRYTTFPIPMAGEWEQDRQSVGFMIDLIRAVVEGRFEEEVWLKDQVVRKTAATLWTASNGRVRGVDLARGPRLAVLLSRPTQRYVYEAWNVPLSPVYLDPDGEAV